MTSDHVASSDDSGAGLLREQVRALQETVRLLESTLLQRLEEIEQTRAELSSQRHLADVHRSEAEGVREKLHDANAWVYHLAGVRRDIEADLARTRARLEEAVRKIDRLNKKHDLVAREKEEAVALGADMQRELYAIAAQNAEIALARQKLVLDVAALRSTCSELHAQKAALQQQVEAERRTIDGLNGAISNLEAEQETQREVDRSARAKCAQSVEALQRALEGAECAAQTSEHEIAALKAELNAMHEALSDQKDLGKWLRLVMLEVRRSRKSWYLLTERQKDKSLGRRLSLVGLFDSDSYLQRYPDVAEQDFDPLHHFVLHGLAEGRQR